MNKTINFHELWAEKHLPNVHQGYKVLAELSEEDAEALIEFLLYNITYEIRVELGLIELNEEQEKEYEANNLGKLYEQVNAIYQEANQGCYFCDKEIDPNETFPDNPGLCLICGMKMQKFLMYLGKR